MLHITQLCPLLPLPVLDGTGTSLRHSHAQFENALAETTGLKRGPPPNPSPGPKPYSDTSPKIDPNPIASLGSVFTLSLTLFSFSFSKVSGPYWSFSGNGTRSNLGTISSLQPPGAW